MMTSPRYFIVLVVLVFEVYGQRYDGQNSYNSNNNRNYPQIPSTSVNCPEKNGRFPTRSCDGYIECVDGVGQEKTCPDGLLFNAASSIFSFPCQYPIDVDCSGREQTQPPQATDECPRQFGYFLRGDASNCGQFVNCVDGKSFHFDCPEGLAFNQQTYRCDWPDQVPTCDAEAYLGFKCPPEARSLGANEYQYFRASDNCQKYYICINGRPRLYNCEEGHAFNEINSACDGIENVTGCAVPQYDHNHNNQYNQNGSQQKPLSSNPFFRG